jgi:hypothetical protein
MTWRSIDGSTQHIEVDAQSGMWTQQSSHDGQHRRRIRQHLKVRASDWRCGQATIAA